MTAAEAYQFGLLPLCVWREARNQDHATKVAVAWTIRNRTSRPMWWGRDYPSVILKPWQYSSFNAADPNSQKFPRADDPSFEDCLIAAEAVFTGTTEDPTGGATHYYDRSLDSKPPTWANSMTRTADIGAFHFYKA